MYKDFVPEQIAKLRIQRGASARDMSLTLGLANNYINNIENKKALPAMRSFFEICEYFEITPQEFFKEKNTYPSLFEEFIDEAKRLSPKQMNSLLGIMRELNGKGKQDS